MRHGRPGAPSLGRAARHRRRRSLWDAQERAEATQNIVRETWRETWLDCHDCVIPRAVRPASLAFTALTTTLTLAAGAFSGSAPKHVSGGIARVATVGAAALRFGRSIGSPTAGHLVGGSHLVETEYLRVEPADMPGDVRWGLEPLVTMLDRAARAERRQFPGVVLSVGHLSRAGGGDVQQHRSHESGRDADVGFFVRSSTGRQLLAPHFVAFRGDGTAPTWPGAYFDDAKNWALVSSLIGDPDAHVTHLFVAAPLRARLLAYAERAGAPQETRMRAAELMQQPHGVLPHDDHFHVRIGCPAHMSGCVENPTARIAHSPWLRDRDRHGVPAHALVTPAPKHVPPEPPALPSVPPSDPAADPAAPPAVLSTPVDDVDG
jgi:penicillin-insensitive murein endopeptidase